MQTRSFRGSGEPAWVNASSNACERLGPGPRRALGPAAIRAASTGRTHDRTRPMLQKRQKALAKAAPSTHDPQETSSTRRWWSAGGIAALSGHATRCDFNRDLRRRGLPDRFVERRPPLFADYLEGIVFLNSSARFSSMSASPRRPWARYTAAKPLKVCAAAS